MNDCFIKINEIRQFREHSINEKWKNKMKNISFFFKILSNYALVNSDSNMHRVHIVVHSIRIKIMASLLPPSLSLSLSLSL